MFYKFYRKQRIRTKNKALDVIYVDFEKAFDKVDIGMLLNKLMLIKTPFYILNWLQDFGWKDSTSLS